MTMRMTSLVLLSFLAAAQPASSAEFTLVTDVEKQPLVAATRRLLEALKLAGSPLGESETQQIEKAFREADSKKAVLAIQRVLDPLCLATVHIKLESRVKIQEGPVDKELVEQGWRTFLVKVRNEAGINSELRVESPSAAPIHSRGRGGRQRPTKDDDLVKPDEVPTRFLDLAMVNRQPLKPQLSGLSLEYRIVQLFSRDVGMREATLAFDVGQGTQDLGFRNEVPILFKCVPAIPVTLGVKDFDGAPTTAAFVIRDQLGRVYPNQARRVAPDFFFHEQVYRADGEVILLPSGKYTATVTRGPEYLQQQKEFEVGTAPQQRLDFQLERWAHPAKRGWYSGDHHVHAAGCAHYESPTEGVGPEAMMRHIIGEDLNIGCVLTWGPCWYTQKENFEGKISSLSLPNYLMRYDVEVSGFPSSHAGHVCLLRLTEDDYPGTKLIEEWPSWTLPVLTWAKEQGGIVGYAHSGGGLGLPDYGSEGNRFEAMTVDLWGLGGGEHTVRHEADTLPDYVVPPFDGIGANEYIVTVAHGMCDFISTVDTPAIWELNIWYHTLNCGMRCRISGETDFPCAYDDKVGLGRVYAKLLPDQELTFDNWVLGVRDGRSYCGDGRTHILDFKVNDVAVGESGTSGVVSELALDQPGKVKVSFDIQALLEEKPSEETEKIRNRRLDWKPYWHIERCRIGESRRIPVEIIVNGYSVARKEIEADGSVQSLEFDVDIQHSSWVAVRVLPSVHTNPVFVVVGDQPIRASRRSAMWCRDAVEVCWNSKKDQIRESERPAARAAYDKARDIYEQVLAEAVAD